MTLILTPGVSEPLPAEEVIQSLNIRVLHRHLGHFGITEVSTEVLFRLKEKVQVCDRQLKAPPLDLHLTPTVQSDSAQKLCRQEAWYKLSSRQL
ncbi:hypothetical protein F7725_022122 [Dissostichus mawsoni]|uniref:PTRR N-terminal domain-containing protein n=1 Tax=Dissostichus mawsoni TaxID=36200 RepID=A0A7J5ZDQ8_DISMA|nr:hypothetical protein F7725_022122 [Dissostichus mawsoni]